MSAIPVVIAGVLGRMGKELVELFSLDKRFSLIAGLISERPNQVIPSDWSFPVVSSMHELDPLMMEHAIIIDFSHFSQLENIVGCALKHQAALLVGSTAHPSSHMTMLSRAAERIAVLYAPNTSIMANLLIEFSHLAAASLPQFSALITDVHHHHKKDAPSGTALAIQKAIEDAEGMLDEVSISSARIGDVTGEHSVHFFKKNERLEMTHRVFDRRIFAEGALFAALFLVKQKAGLYDMADVLNLNLTIENRPN